MRFNISLHPGAYQLQNATQARKATKQINLKNPVQRTEEERAALATCSR